MGCKVLCTSVALLAYLMFFGHVRAECTQPSFASRNVVLSNHLSTQNFTNGSTVTFECVIGHKPVDPKASRSVTCEGNQWTSLELSCTRKSCGSLADFSHGRYDMTGNLFGDTAKPVCDKGYMLAGKETTRTCRDQGWDGRDPLCESVKCSAPPAIENGQLVDEPLESYNYLEAVFYRCNKGLNLIGASTLHCSEDGTFKPDPPKCFVLPTTTTTTTTTTTPATPTTPKPPKRTALPTPPTTTTTPVTSTTPKPSERTAPWVVALIVVIVLIAVGVIICLIVKRKRSKHLYSDKVATDNQEDRL